LIRDNALRTVFLNPRELFIIEDSCKGQRLGTS
jgi:hypothetical protein